GGDQRVRLDVVVGMSQEVRDVEDEVREYQEEHDHGQRVLDGRVRREGDGVGLLLDFNAGRVGLAGHVQGPDVQDNNACDHEGQQIVQREEAVERRVVDSEAAQQKLLDPLTHHRNSGEEASDHGCTPEAHLAPRENVTHESGRHHEEVDHAAKDPEHFARSLVGAVIEATHDVDIDGDEEERCTVGVHVADQPTRVDVAHDLFNGVEGDLGVSRIV